MNENTETGPVIDVDQPVENTQITVRDAISALERTKPLEPPALVTAAQAKIDAVANLTAACMAKASELRLTLEESNALQELFPDEAFQTGAAGKESLIYIQHSALRDRFNRVLGLGQWVIIPRSRWAEDYEYWNKDTKRNEKASRVYVEAMLLIRGCFISENIGDMTYYHNNASTNYGDAVEGATTQAFRRCAKMFGVGLQAWDKSWCEGWWTRKRAGFRAGASPEPRKAPGAPQTPPKPVAPATGTTATPTEAHKARVIALLNTAEGLPVALEFLQKIAALLPNEGLEDLPLEFVPATKEQMDGLMRAIGEFAGGAEARLPYPKHVIPVAKPAKAPVNVSREAPNEPDASAKDQSWYGTVILIPRKGQKRDQYLQAPDTIGSLWEARHGTDEASQEARQRLWGFTTNWEPKGWTKRDGTEMPPSEADLICRKALDQFKEWFDAMHPNEKL